MNHSLEVNESLYKNIGNNINRQHKHHSKGVNIIMNFLNNFDPAFRPFNEA